MEVVERVIKLYREGKFLGYRVVFGDIAYDIYKDSFDSFATIEYICVKCLNKTVEKQELIKVGVDYKTDEELKGSFLKSVWDVTNDIKGIRLLHLKLKLCLNSELLHKEKVRRSSNNLLYYFVNNIGYKKDIYVSRGINGIKVKKMLDSKDYIEYTLTPKYTDNLLSGIVLEMHKKVFNGVNYSYITNINGVYTVDTLNINYKSDLRRCRLRRLNIRSNSSYSIKNTDSLKVIDGNVVYNHKVVIKLIDLGKESLSHLIDNFNAS